MKNKIAAYVAVALVTLGGGAIFASNAVAQTNQNTIGVAAQREKHPELRRAMRKLNSAKTDLQKASRDFGGHRAKAAQLIDQAMAEVREAMKYDKN